MMRLSQRVMTYLCQASCGQAGDRDKATNRPHNTPVNLNNVLSSADAVAAESGAAIWKLRCRMCV